MATLKAELKDILNKYGIDPRDKSKLWDCHGTLVLYHRAYEIIAAKERIAFDPPTVIEAKSSDKIVALLVTGRMGERSEWSIGEAAPANCKNAYPYAIAEKRAKDRVIAKLVGLAEYVYSEDEAEEFKDAPKAAVEAPAPISAPPARSAAPLAQPAEATKAADPERVKRVNGARERRDRIHTALENAKTPKLIDEIIDVNSHDLTFIKEVHEPAYAALMQLAAARKTELLAAA